MNDQVIARMLRFKEWREKTAEDVKSLIVRGHEIKAVDKKVLDESGVLRSHHHLSDYDKEAIGTSSQYDIMLQIQSEESDDLPDEEE